MAAAEDLRKGLNAARAGRRAKARAAFRAALRKDPVNETALLGLAYLAKDPRASLAYIVRVLDAHPRSSRARAALQWALQRLTNPPVVDVPDGRPSAPLPTRWGTHQAAAGVALLAGLFLLAFLLGWTTGLLWRAEPPAVAAVVATSTAPPAPTVAETSPPSATPSPTAVPPTPTPGPTPSPPTPTQTSTPTPSPTAAPLPPPPTSPPPPVPTPVPIAHVEGWRWIDIDLTNQVLTAYEGSTPVRATAVSTGLPRTPTPTGQFRIYARYVYDDMTGPGYYLPNVPYTMYFYRGYGLHGTYWHSNFGQPMSHGCVNLPTPEAEWIFAWAEVGTLVNIHY